MNRSSLRWPALALLSLAFQVPSTLFASQAGDDAARRWTRFEPEFQAFATADRAKPPGQGGILFVGSNDLKAGEVAEEDRLHFHPPAYVEFARIMKPVLKRVWREVEAPGGEARDLQNPDQP